MSRNYRPEIDGLRAVAVIPVILFHAGFPLFSGGYIGVDVFFVISGYLISSILLNEMAENKFSFAGFYERRVRRILPALYFVMATCMLVGWFLLDPFELKELSQSVFATSIFSSNFYFYLKHDYFDVSSELKPLLHTWSLGVEEQFYLIFPISLFLLQRLGRIVTVLTYFLLFLFSLLLASSLIDINSDLAFYMLPTRAWELLIGVFCTFTLLFLSKRKPLAADQWLTGIGFFCIIIPFFTFTKNTPTPSFYTLIPTLGAALIIVFSSAKSNLTRRILSFKPLVAIGLISYSLYLWHQPVLAYYRVWFMEDPSSLNLVVILSVILLLSIFTYKLIEVPSRKYVFAKSNKLIVLSLCFLITVAIGLVGLAGHLSKGFPERNIDMLRLAQNGGLSFECSGADMNNLLCKTSTDPQVILLGDSYAMHLGRPLGNISSSLGLWQLTLSGCPPVREFTDARLKSRISCYDYNHYVFDSLNKLDEKNKRTIVMSSSNDLSTDIYKNDFKNTVLALKAQGFKVVLVSPTPKHSETHKCIKQEMRNNKNFHNCAFSLSSANNTNVFVNLAQLTDDLEIGYVDLSDLFCESGKCSIYRDGKLLLRDIGHLSNESTDVVTNFLLRSDIFLE